MLPQGGPCDPVFDQLAHYLSGFSCHGAPAFVDLRNPFHLANGTMPFLELMMVVGAVLAFVHAFRRLRREGDPTNLVLCIGSIVYLLFTEVPLYYSHELGLGSKLGTEFAHDTFTVTFLYDRLPLYIVALYPVVTTLAYEVVRSLGIFKRHNIVVAAICVGVVHHCFYEVFDQLGPQLRWWAWNVDNPNNQPLLRSVPVGSIVIFAFLGPVVLTTLLMLFVGRKVERGERLSGASLTWRTFLVGLLVVPGIAIISTPLGLPGDHHPDGKGLLDFLLLGIGVLIAVPVMVGAVRNRGDSIASPYVLYFGPVYLLVLTALWISALPDYRNAVHGVTSDNTPIGSLLYAAVCAVLAVTAIAITRRRTAPADDPARTRVGDLAGAT